MKYFLIILLLLFSTVCRSYEIAENLTIRHLYTYYSGKVYVSFNETESLEVCSYYGGEIFIGPEQEGVQEILSSLLAARVSGKSLTIFYEATTGVEGSNHNSGCSEGVMAKLVAVVL